MTLANNERFINNYKIISLIGSGGYGLVFKILNILDNRYYAVKIILNTLKKNNDRNEKDMLLNKIFKENDNMLNLPSIDFSQFDVNETQGQHTLACLKEISLHLKVHSHPNILSILEIFNYNNSKYPDINIATLIVMDYHPRDLFTSIVEDQLFVNDGYLIKKVFLQLCSAVYHCHSLNVYHCDIKAENILFNPKTKSVYLCDFGLSTMSDTIAPNLSVGSSYYMAPERTADSMADTDLEMDYFNIHFPPHMSDIWSMGIILINLTCIRNIWLKAHYKNDCLFKSYIDDNNVLKNLLPLSDEFFQLLIKILKVNPMERISLIELMELIKELKMFTSEGPLSTVAIMNEVDFRKTIKVTDEENENNEIIKLNEQILI